MKINEYKMRLVNLGQPVEDEPSEASVEIAAAPSLVPSAPAATSLPPDPGASAINMAPPLNMFPPSNVPQHTTTPPQNELV